MISESGSVEAMLRAPGLIPPFTNGLDHSRLDRLDPMQNQLCRVCDEPAAGFHFGAFTCEGCKSFFGRTCNNQSVIQECKNNYRCVVDKKNRTACKACRLRKCLMVGMSKSGSRYGRRSNWFKIHCLMQQNMNGAAKKSPTGSSSTSSLSPTSAPPPPMPTLPSSAPPPPLPQPSSLWHSPPKSESREATPPNLPNSPEPPAHRPFTTASSLLPPPPAISTLSPSPTASASPDSPFKAYIPPSLSPSKPIAPTPLATPTALPSVPAAPPLTSLYSGFPLASLAAFPGIPLHKQALLSPLLAHSHLWQMAAASRHPLLAGLAAAKPELSASSPGLDLLAEHKALMERFAAATQVAAAAAAAAAASGKEEIKREEDDADSVASRRSPASSVAADAAAPSPAEPQNAPMDLSGPRKELLEVTSSSEDVNRNRLVKSEESLLVDLCAKKKAASPPASL